MEGNRIAEFFGFWTGDTAPLDTSLLLLKVLSKFEVRLLSDL